MKHVLKSGFSLFTIAAIVTLLIAMVHERTLEPIAQKIQKTQERTMKEVLSQASDFAEISAAKTGSIVKIFEGYSRGMLVGYVIELAPQGYSGAINMMVGISKTNNMITGMRIIKHSETPGLGALAVKENFYRQYDFKKPVPLRVVKNSPRENEIAAITSATITTVAITDAVNEAIKWYNEVISQ